MIIITSAIYGKHPVTGENSCVNTIINGVAWSVPIDLENSHYKAILEWVEEGNTIEEAE